MNKKKSILSIIIGIIFIIVIYNFYTTFSLDNNYTFQSEVYEIENGLIKNISPQTDVNLFKEYFDIKNCDIIVKDKNNNELTKGYIPKGSTTIVKKNNNIIETYTNIITGDITEDGFVDNNDLTSFGNFLITNQTTTNIQNEVLDIDKSNDIHLNDLMILEKTIQNDYKDLNISKDNIILQTNETTRVVANITPNYGLNTNAIWTSSNEEIATVKGSGIITGHAEGETTIIVKTQDSKLSKSITVKVDNTIQLSSYNGTAYVEGEELKVPIKSIDYNNLTCTSNNEGIATCRITDQKLQITANSAGTTTITVNSENYGTKTYRVTCIDPYINLQYTDYACVKPNGRPSAGIFISSLNAGTLSLEISDNEIINYARIEDNVFKIQAGTKTGRGEVTIKGTNSNKTKKFTLDVYNLAIPEIGKIAYVGEEISTEIIKEGTNILTCTSPDETKATCRIEENNLYVQPLAPGEVTIKVNNKLIYNEIEQQCGEATFLVVVRER